MSDALGWLSQILGGDPEAAGAAQNSMAMQPAVLDYLNDVATGKIAREGVLGQSYYDPNRSFRENVLDPRAMDQAMGIALGFGPGVIKSMAEPWILPAYREMAAPRRIFAGETHHGIELPEGLNTLKVDEGFLNDKGHFLNRQRAYNYADKHGLMDIPSGWRGAELWSEAGLKIPQQAYDYLARYFPK